MQEALNEAKEEMKRVDHLIYVSLKYTRTVDVLMNTIASMIDAYDFILEALLKHAFEKNLVEQIPVSPRERGDRIKEVFDDQIIRDNVDLYFLLRKLSKSNPEREHEYRRNVCMVSYVDNRKEIVDIDIITDYFAFQMNFLNYVASLILSAEESA